MLIQLICSILVLTGVAQTLGPPQSVRQFLQQVLHAHLGAATVDNIQAIGDQTGPDGVRQPVRIYAQGSKNARIERGTGAATSVAVSANGAGWFERDGKTIYIPPHAVQQRVTLFPFLDLLSEVNNPASEVTYKDTIVQGTSTQYRIHVRLRDLHPETRFLHIALDEDVDFDIDAQTLLVVRSERSNMTIENMYLKIPLVQQFSDYRTVNGVAVPFRIITTEGTRAVGIHISTTVIQSVQINAGIPPTLFQQGGQQ